jgi:diacylglycerol kinase family enzyme
MPDTPSSAQDLLNQRVIAVLNTGSGGCDASAAGRMNDIFSAAGLRHAEVVSVPPAQIEAALKRAATLAEVVVVLGGDGTIRSAAAQCSLSGKLLIPLPGGTMNMLPRALYGTMSWPQILADILTTPCIRDVSGGRIGSEPFFCAAVLGAPSLWADAREALRHLNVIEATKRAVTAIRRHADEPLEYRMGDGPPGKAEAIAVICPLVSRAMGHDELSLEAAAIEPVAAAALFRLAFHAMFDDWRNDPGISLARVTVIDVKGHGRVPVILDGERVRMGRNLRVEFVPLAFRALAPKSPAWCTGPIVLADKTGRTIGSVVVADWGGTRLGFARKGAVCHSNIPLIDSTIEVRS